MGTSWSDCSSSVKSTLNCCCGKIKCCGRSGEYEVYELPRPPSCDAAEKASADILTIKSIDLCFSLNGEDHHTDKYELMSRPLDRCLVVRRGQPFKIDITLNRQYNAEKDAVSFIFSVADEEKPKFGTATLVAIPLLTITSSPSPPESWTAVLESQISNHIMVQITPASNCIVGPWKVDIDTKKQGDGSLCYTHPRNIYILFNPWCPSDEVYMEGRDNREEYILADTGLIWRGSYNRLRPSIWKYSQFDKDILDCSLYLLREVGKLRGHGRGDPVLAARVLSAAVNAQDDSGAVVGNWSTDFGGGTHPTQWVGSMKILQTYYKKKKPVKYGQCWVFAGVLTTICRAVGIPARVVTAFSAAHDTQSSLTVDYFVDEKGSIMEEYNSDSIWNYHVWSEVWMKRPDLGPEYGGWQALDATPQQPSDNIFRCGPASVLAVKQGDILKPYDNAFLFAEVNADKVYWKYTGPTQPLKMIRKDTVSIGQFISTKAVLKWEREDITENYKFPEKSVEERDTMLKALRKSESLFARYYLNEQFNDVRFDFALRDDIKIGEDFSVVVVIKNISTRKDHEVSVNLRVDTVTYMGKISDAVKQQNYKIVLKPEDINEVKMTVTFDEYYKKLVDQCAFNIACMANVSETKYEYFAQDDFRVRKPDIKIIVNGTPTSKQEFEAVIKLENPLPIPLRKGKFLIEGIGLEEQLKIPLKENVAPGEFATTTVKLTPPWGGRHTIAAKFTSKELNDVDGFLVINVKVPKDYMPGIETNEV